MGPSRAARVCRDTGDGDPERVRIEIRSARNRLALGNEELRRRMIAYVHFFGPIHGIVVNTGNQQLTSCAGVTDPMTGLAL
jgi:hypothetical protein